ncbi:serine/threonine protein kinase [Brevibacillus parabrevis]|uniref:Serine/threonine protein kinase n=1 Tax=Brevibacillus parabrevis TaxID=54914 RepID=A0A4Y3PTT6_BREPA|nr:protein kinase [Brevibacillus parabrevis]RNB94499.1 serine/threonine-protein kinase [Brevibacillus parabrevis]GEB33761.1 serine/threonine protein kinase [Brevibacillus parabrevis]
MWTEVKEWWTNNVRDKPYRAGTVAGAYQIKQVLGMGSYGIAYLAIHRATGEKVVLKQVKPSLRHTPKGEAMQEYERKVLSSLSHPQFPRCLDAFRFRNDSFLVMTYLTGPTLEEMLFERGIVVPERQCALYMKQIGELVAYLHDRGLIHRDVRIPNVIWQEGNPYLIDFGLARFVGDKPTYTEETLSAYPSEKQLKREVAPSSDLYALGHFFLFLLYSGYSADENAPERSWEEELSLSPEIRLMIRKLFQLDTPYSTVREWLADLDAYLQTGECPASEYEQA